MIHKAETQRASYPVESHYTPSEKCSLSTLSYIEGTGGAYI